MKQQEVLYLITGYTFVASLHFMLDVVGAWAGMSQIMQLKRRCIALEDCVEVLERAERWEGPGWTGFQKDPKKKPSRTRSKKNCPDRMVDAMGQFSRKKNARPPKKKKKRGQTKRSKKKKRRLQRQSSAKYPCSFPNPDPTPFSPFPFLECTKISVAQCTCGSLGNVKLGLIWG